jgi:pimeloyl-ACP methyl ester carboxylesterase
VAHPERVSSAILWWPVGGAKYRIRAQTRFAEHVAFAQAHGLALVVAHAMRDGKSFAADARGGPWASVLKRDAAFAEAYAKLDVERYASTVLAMQHALFDRDTAPGAEPEDLLRLDLPTLIVPGRDEAHATSAARYLEECIPGAEYWDVPVADQTELAASQRLLEFLDQANARSRP